MILHIQRLEVMASVGVHDWEKTARQRIVADIWVRFDGAKAAETDMLADTLDYTQLESLAVRVLQANHYNLLEHMVKTMGEAILASPGVQEVTVEIAKPGALKQAQSVSIKETYT